MTDVADALEAIARDDVETLRRLLVARPGLASARGPDGVSLLLAARYRWSLLAVEAILEARPQLDVFDAAALGRTEEAAALLDEDPGRGRSLASDGFTALHLASYFGHLDVARLLLERGAEVDAIAMNAQRVTPLHAAAELGDEELAEAFLTAGADATARNDTGLPWSDGPRMRAVPARHGRRTGGALSLGRPMPDPNGLDELLRLFLPAELSTELRFILDVGAAVGVAVVGGLLATRLGLPALVGYLVAGVVIGPFTPGFIGEQERIGTLAELGIVLLLFTLGVQFSVSEIREVGAIAVAGATTQVVLTTLIGAAGAMILGVPLAPAVVVAAALSISSTLVMVKVVSAYGDEGSLHARVAVGWAAVQDLLTIFLIVALPALAGAEPLLPLLVALIKATVFLALAYVVGTRLLPGVLLRVSRLGSSELFLLTVMATALLAAIVSSAVFGLSLALGAFVAGLIVSESDLSHQAAAEVIPFRDLFAVLFFVSVGMLIDPATLPASALLITVLVLAAGPAKWLVTAALGRALRLPARSAILLGASLAHAGEFTFVLGREALTVGALGAAEYQALLGATAVSIVIAPAAYGLAGRIAPAIDARAARLTVDEVPADHAAAEDPTRNRHVVVLGGGQTGWLLARALAGRGFTSVIVDRDRRRLEEFERLGVPTVFGDAANPRILGRVLQPTTRIVAICLPDPLTARLAAERIRAIAPRVEIVARVRRPSERELLRRAGVRRFADERAEAGIELARQALQRLGVSSQELAAVVQGLRREAYGP